jgi:zinc/manganese transport system substrate-binding protein
MTDTVKNRNHVRHHRNHVSGRLADALYSAARWICVAGMLAAGFMAAPGNPVQASQIRIVTTTSDLADIAGAIAGDTADVTALSKGNEDPHFLQAKPGFIIQARHADLWISIGMELEIGWEPAVIHGSRNSRIQVGRPGYLDVSANVLKRGVPTRRVTRDMGDVHPSGNPHYWLDPWNGRVIADTIADRLSTLFPDKRDVFQSNLNTFKNELDQRMFGAALVDAVGGEKLWQRQRSGTLDDYITEHGMPAAGGWYASTAPLRGVKMVTFHKSWEYFAGRFGMFVVAELEPKPGVPPTAAHLSHVENLMRAENISIILQEPFYSRRAADRVARNTQARVVVAAGSVGGTLETSDYFTIFDLLIAALTNQSQ